MYALGRVVHPKVRPKSPQDVVQRTRKAPTLSTPPQVDPTSRASAVLLDCHPRMKTHPPHHLSLFPTTFYLLIPPHFPKYCLQYPVVPKTHEIRLFLTKTTQTHP